MSINYGRPASPEAFIIAKLVSLGRAVGPEKDELETLPCYVVTALPAGVSDNFSRTTVVSVHSFDSTRALAYSAADDADELLINSTASDLVTLPSGLIVGGTITTNLVPGYADYQDPRIKRYVGRYNVELRFV